MTPRSKDRVERFGLALGRGLDRLLAPFAPAWALGRAVARTRFHAATVREVYASTFAAAERSRLTSDWPSKQTSADSAWSGDARTILARCRQAVRDDWCAASGVAAYRRHVVGTGISLRADARDDAGEPIGEFNRALDVLWARWGQSPSACDSEGRKTQVEIQGLAVQEFATVGEAFAVRSYERRADTVGLMLQMFEPEQLDWNLTIHRPTGYAVYGGIETDAAGRAVAYHVYLDSHPNDPLRPTVRQSVRIPAERVCHLMREDRPRQTHGVSRLVTVLVRLRHLAMYDQYEVVAKRMEACIGISKKADTTGGPGFPAILPPAGTSTTDAAGNEELRFEPGMVLDQEVALINPQRPGAIYDPFMRRQITQASAGMGLDYPTVCRDFTGATFSGQRQAMLERDKETDPIQSLLADLWLRPIWEDFVMTAVLEGRVAAPAGFWTDASVRASCLRMDWQPPAKPWVDPARQAAAAKIALDYCLTTRDIEARQIGEHAGDLLVQKSRELDEAERLRVPLPDGRPGARSAPPVSPNEPRPVRDDAAPADDPPPRRPDGDEEEDAAAAGLVAEALTPALGPALAAQIARES